MVGKTANEIAMWDFNILGGAINLYKVIDEYIQLHRRLMFGTERFFLRTKPEAVSKDTFFIAAPLGKNSFNGKIRAACQIAGLSGDGFICNITVHTLRVTMIQWLLNANHTERVIAKRTGHKDLKSLKSYNTLRGDATVFENFPHASTPRVMTVAESCRFKLDTRH